MEALFKLLIWAGCGIAIYIAVLGVFAIGHLFGVDNLITGTAILAVSIFVAAERMLDTIHKNTIAIIQTLGITIQRIGSEDYSIEFQLGLITAILRRITPPDPQ